jgi:tRNA (guanine37-N1)-methyltransferase
MILKPEPLFKAVRSIRGELAPQVPRVVLLTPQGRRLDQDYAQALAESRALILLCGRYEGVDERVTRRLVTDEISIGDFVLSGGELAACLLIECVVRLLPGALNNSSSAHNESFRAGQPAGKVPLLDYPQFTRPEVFEEMKVPEVLLSGHHQKVALWRRKMSIEKTLKNRPDLLKYEGLSDEDKRLLAMEFD